MNISTVNSYIELTKLVKFLRSTISEFDLDISETFIILVGCNSVGLKYNDLLGYKCRTNHYLIEALGVPHLPTLDEINLFKRQLARNELTNLNKLSRNLQNMGKNRENNNSIFDFINDGNMLDVVLDHITNILINELRNNDIIFKENKYFSDEQKEDLEQNGFLIIPYVLDEHQVKILAELTLFIAKNEQEVGVAYNYGGKDNKLQRVYNLISKHPIYIELLEITLVKEILEFYFKRDTLHHKYVLSSFQSNILHPGSQAQQLHIDGWGAVVNPLPSWPTRLNINFLLTDWTDNNGSTLVLPGSHKFQRSPKPEEVKESDLTKLIAPKGSIVIWSGHTWHKSGTNYSNKLRFGLFSCFAASHLKEVSTEEEHLLVVDQKVMDNLSSEMRFMIGLDRGIKKGACHRVDFLNTEFEELTL